MRLVWLLPFVASWPAAAQGQNLLVNPRFDTDLSGWTASGTGSGWSSMDADGAVTSGSAFAFALVSPRGPCTSASISQCVPVDAWAYDWSGAFRWRGTGVASALLGFYRGTDCTEFTGWSDGVGASPGTTTPPPETWTSFNRKVVRPAAARSALVTLAANTCPGGPFPYSVDAWMDNLSVVPAPLPPPMAFHTLTPCRLFDSRDGDGPALAGGSERTVATGGKCDIPASAKALSINLTVTESTGAGNLRLRAANEPPPDTSMINYGPGQTRANSATVRMADGQFRIQVDQGAGVVHVIVDVNGYYE